MVSNCMSCGRWCTLELNLIRPKLYHCVSQQFKADIQIKQSNTVCNELKCKSNHFFVAKANAFSHFGGDTEDSVSAFCRLL